MHPESADDLIHALRGSGLFDPEQFDALLRELTPLGADAEALVNHLVGTERVTHYQLKKVLAGRAAELFVGPYVVTDRLGSGGMSRVYRARERATGRPLALKVVRPALVANPTVRGRYAREVQATGRLDHPNIVRVYDAGEAGGKVYLAMEFVDGIDLALLLHEFGSVEVAEACEYVRQVALGLQHAHERGFVHRDIKPGNIVVAGERHLPQATEPAVVKILDLGLARAIDPDDMVVPNLTRDHAVVGTPDYMAPEQAKDSKHVDARADLYSLGCTFYFLLTGRVPFPVEGALEKILAHQSELPSPVQAFRPDVPAAVAELVARLMAKRPQDRIQTAGELAEALAPHARYPTGADAVGLLVRTPPVAFVRSKAARDHGTASSIGSVTPLSLSGEVPQAARVPLAPPVTPSDATPRPHAVSPSAAGGSKTSAGAKRAPRKRARRAAGPSIDVPQYVWVAVALCGVAILVLMLWLVGNQ